MRYARQEERTQYRRLLSLIITVGFFGFVFGYFLFPSHGFHTWFFDLLVLFPWLFLVPFYPQIVPYQERLFLLTTVLIVYLWITVFWSTDLSLYAVWDFGRLVVYLVCLLSTVWLVATQYPDSEDFLFRGLIIVGAIHALVSLTFHFSTFGLQFAVLNPLGRMNNPVRAAHVYGAVALLAAWSYLNESRRKAAALDGLAAITLLTAMVFTKARGPLVMWFVSMGFVILLTKGTSEHKLRLCLREGLLLGGVILLGTLVSGTQRWEAVLPTQYGFRLDIWPAVLRDVPNFLWFGQGVRDDTRVFLDSGLVFANSHNFLLSVLRFGGLVGLSLMLIQLGYSFLTAFRNGTANSRLWGILLIYGCLSLLTSGKYPLRKPTETWLIFWIPIAFLCAWDARKRRDGHARMTEGNRVNSV